MLRKTESLTYKLKAIAKYGLTSLFSTEISLFRLSEIARQLLRNASNATFWRENQKKMNREP